MLKKRSDFLSLFKNGQRIYPSSKIILNYHFNNKNNIRLGYTVPKYVGTAVLRNKLKRWCREFFRNSCSFDELKKRGFDLNVVFKRDTAEFYSCLDYSELDSQLALGISKLKAIGTKKGRFR